MTLDELAEPIFTYVCRLNRTAQAGGQMDYPAVRADIEERFRNAEFDARQDARLLGQWQRIELPLIFFVDAMISESGLAIAREWNENRLAYERKELAGDEKFFDLLDETLADKAVEANERLLVFYSCLGLGFTGWYAGQEDTLLRKQKEIAARIGKEYLKYDPDAYVTPESYEHNDLRDLIEPPGRKLAGIVVAVIGLGLTLLVLNVMLYRTAVKELADNLDRIEERHDLANEARETEDGR